MPATRRTTSRAKNPVPRRKPRSSALRRGDGVFFMECSPNVLELDPLESFHLQGDDLGGQRRVAELGRELLSVAQGPLHELDHGLRLRLVLGALVEKQPGERSDR